MRKNYLDLMEKALSAYSDEHIPEDDVFGVLTEFFRKDKHVLCTDKKYLRYAERRVKTYKFRRFWVLGKIKVFRLGGKVLRVLRLKK